MLQTHTLASLVPQSGSRPSISCSDINSGASLAWVESAKRVIVGASNNLTEKLFSRLSFGFFCGKLSQPARIIRFQKCPHPTVLLHVFITHAPCEGPRQAVRSSQCHRRNSLPFNVTYTPSALFVKLRGTNSQITPRHLYWCNYDNKKHSLKTD